MRIIYFTTALEKEDYVAFCKNWRGSLNTTIQNLHNRLIRALALTHEVDVISVRPYSKKYCKLKKLDASITQEGKITWHYLEVKRRKLFRVNHTKRDAKILLKMNLKDAIILTDTLNPYILKASTSLAEDFHLPIIGVCNNTPSGIHDTGKSYTTNLHSMADNLSGYITQTTNLNELFNKHNRANITIEGVLENKYNEEDVKKYGKYIFYYGNLEERFGVYDLIQAFIELNNPNINLVIAGYHANEEKMDKFSKFRNNIKYLGMISNDLMLSLENGSLFNINSRPYSEDFDRYLIPYNTLDYLNSKSLTVSVRNNILLKTFKDDALWLELGEKEELINVMNKALKMSEKEKEEIIKKANNDANKLYSMSVVNHKLILFLKQFLKQRE